MMKRIAPISILKMLVVICLFVLGPASGQSKKQSEKTLFGKEIAPEKVNPENGVIRCGTTEYESYLQEKHPKRMKNSQFESWIAPLIQNQASMRTSQTNAIITIPIVVHVIYNGQAVGTAPNISDVQVESQITVLNQDFRKTGPGSNTNPVGADTEIQFVLAKQDPNGNPTNGIDRVSLCKDSWTNSDIETILKPNTIWDPTQYLNLWTVELDDNKLLGYAQFPEGSGLIGLSGAGGTAATDGVVIRYNAFGSGIGPSYILKSPYNRGRTTTHEIGHWLGLIHIWGEGSSCASNNDHCADTPTAKDPNYGCPTGMDSCTSRSGVDMIENYMDYTDDSCMNIFTQNQKTRMNTVMTNSPRRSSLKTSNKGNAIPLFANDAEVKLESSCAVATCSTNPNQTLQNITIYNRGTSTLTSATLNYSINGGSSIPYPWTGSLATNKFATFPVTINSSINGTIIVSIDKANGVTDQIIPNNSAIGSFVVTGNPSNYTFTNYLFRLQQDYYGSETTWNLKNNTTGAIVDKGGPYTDTYENATTVSKIPNLITQNWTLANNQCYTFTINDSGKDGICCGTALGDSGTGYYDIKSSDGLTVITSGASFTASQSKSFTTNSLGNKEFETFNAIFLYPNPTKGTLNISVPSSFGLPNGYTITNTLGQIILQKEVSEAIDLTINTSSLSNGIYFITVTKENDKKTMRFIKD
jgi:hypothetical protein